MQEHKQYNFYKSAHKEDHETTQKPLKRYATRLTQIRTRSTWDFEKTKTQNSTEVLRSDHHGTPS